MSNSHVPEEILNEIMDKIDEMLTDKGYEETIPNRLDVIEVIEENGSDETQTGHNSCKKRNPCYPPTLPKWIDC